MRISGSVEERLLARRAISDSGCWEWTGSLNMHGYGQLNINRKPIGCHRLAYECWIGEIPEGFSVCHRCDNPPCFNPEHLFAGSHKENMEDMSKKGRAGKLMGEEAHNATFSAVEAAEIRNAYSTTGISTRELAGVYGTNGVTIHNIVRNLTYADPTYDGKFPRKYKFNQPVLDALRQMYGTGMYSTRELAKEFNVSKSYVSKIVRNRCSR